ncbi:MAG: WecB/TagA/CpsF family glycosyltransferase [Candidatus Doudnabacteria bacterium]|nr:WecB/TagA/CpsF family glycosyltransferase [Candidatus Doudnabacteria bacterium]
MNHAEIAGVRVDNISTGETIQKIQEFVRSGQAHYIVTPYSEMIVFALNDPKYKEVLNNADLSLPDGVGVVFGSRLFGTRIDHRVTGRLLVYDIAALAEANGYTLALVGGINNVAAQAAYNLKRKYPNLKINLALSGRPFDENIIQEINHSNSDILRPFDENIIQEINHSNSDILLLAYSPPKQEKWLAENLKNLNVKVAIGLGGTFDYLAGIRLPAPKFVHYVGLEWLWRLVTQPWRIKRIWNAVPVFVWKVLIYKMGQLTHPRESGDLD